MGANKQKEDSGSVENWYPKCLCIVVEKTLLHLKVQRMLTPSSSKEGLHGDGVYAKWEKAKAICLHSCQMAKQASILFMSHLLKLHSKALPSSPFYDMRCKVSVSPFWEQMHNFLPIAVFFWSLEMCLAFLQQTRKVKRYVPETSLWCLNAELT